MNSRGVGGGRTDGVDVELPVGRGGALIGCAVAVVGVALVLFALSGRTVDQAETCAVTRLGKLSYIAEPGWHFRWPFVDEFHCYSSRVVIYETSETPELSSQDYRDTLVDTNTLDGQRIDVAYSVAFSVAPEDVACAYNHVGADMETVARAVVATLSRSDVRNEMKRYSAEALYSGNVDQAQLAVEGRLRASMAARCSTLDRLTIREIRFTPEYANTIEQKQQEAVKVDTARYMAQQRIIGEAAEAKARAIRASGTYTETTRIAEAEAAAIRSKGQALRENPQVLQLEFIDKQKVQWGIMPPGAVPLLSLPGGGAAGP